MSVQAGTDRLGQPLCPVHEGPERERERERESALDAGLGKRHTTIGRTYGYVHVHTRRRHNIYDEACTCRQYTHVFHWNRKGIRRARNSWASLSGSSSICRWTHEVRPCRAGILYRPASTPPKTQMWPPCSRTIRLLRFFLLTFSLSETVSFVSDLHLAIIPGYFANGVKGKGIPRRVKIWGERACVIVHLNTLWKLLQCKIQFERILTHCRPGTRILVFLIRTFCEVLLHKGNCFTKKHTKKRF